MVSRSASSPLPLHSDACLVALGIGHLTKSPQIGYDIVCSNTSCAKCACKNQDFIEAKKINWYTC